MCIYIIICGVSTLNICCFNCYLGQFFSSLSRANVMSNCYFIVFRDDTIDDSTDNAITEGAKTHGSKKNVRSSTNKHPLNLHHESHKEHELTLMTLRCDACWEEVKDSSYVCTTCRFCIHSECALLPFIILEPPFHHHPLNLIYSIPEMYRYFMRFCEICDEQVHTNFWAYYCHKCRYFVHIKCATTPHTMV